MANVVINDFSSQTVSQADDSFVIQEVGGTTKKMSKLLLAQSIAYAGYKSYDNFTASRPSASTVTVGWTQLGIEGIIAGAQSLTIDITASGLLGLDTGAEAADAWYYIWAIAKIDGTVSAILSASSTAPTMPAGYTLKRLVSMVRNTSGDFVAFVQENDRWGYVANTVINSTAAFVSETRDCTTFIPETIKKADIQLLLSVLDTGGAPALGTAVLYNYANGAYYPGITGQALATTASYDSTIYISGTLGVSSRYIKYATIDSVSATSVNTVLSIIGFEVPL